MSLLAIARSLASAIDAKSAADLTRILSDNYIYRPHPARLGSFGQPDGFNKKQFVGMISSLTSVTRWNIDIADPLKVIEGNDALCVHWSAAPETPGGGNFETEFVWMLDIQDGKVSVFNEFFDTVYINEVAAASK